jgi:hypothetical protein
MTNEENNVSSKAIVPEDKHGLVSRSPTLISRGLQDLTSSLDSIIVEMAKVLHDVDRPEGLIAKMIMKANEVLRSEAHSLFLADGIGGLSSPSPLGFEGVDFKPIHIRIREGVAECYLDTPTKRTGAGLAGWVARTGEVVVVPDTSKDSRFVMEVDGQGTTEVHSIVAAPVSHRGRCLGVVELVNCIGAEGFSKRKLVLLEALTDLAAIAIENARHIDTVWDLGLTDRSWFDFDLDIHISSSSRTGCELSLIGIDLNLDGMVHSKTGQHPWGPDKREVPWDAWASCVKQVAKALTESCSGWYWIFRCSNTRFTIMTRGAPGEAITEKARRTALDLSRKFSNAEWLSDYQFFTVKLPVCVGVVSFPKDASNKDQLLQILEETISLVRRSGRGGVADADQGILQPDDEI